MTKIFISYRRDDSADITGRIYDRLIAAFGRDSVFKDVDSIPFGINFKTHLESVVQQCAVELVVIGKSWLEIADSQGNRRLDDPRDFVRIEVESALTRGIPVIPLLVGGAEMPAESSLPPTLAELVYRNGTAVRRDPDFHRDMDRVIAALRELVSTASAPQSATSLVASLLPAPFAWVDIPAGKVTLLLQSFDLRERYYLKANQTVNVGPFAIAKYPVTNAQYALFVAAEGYHNPQWWTAEGWRLRQQHQWSAPRHWTNARWNGADYPVVGVAWHEAVAYCQWLSSVTNEAITLPTEAQWQLAAQGPKGLTYPWGNQWDGNRCNHQVEEQVKKQVDNAESKATTPVYQYEAVGASAFGVVDMAGNTYDWCLTDYFHGGNTPNTTATQFVQRGGSWVNHSERDFMCSARDKDDAEARSYHLGFRLARA